MTQEHSSPIFFRVDPGSGTPLYQQLVDAVSRAVASGAAVPGDPLPSVRELAVELRINLNTVSRAYQRLKDLGLAEARRGVGLFIANGAGGESVRDRLARLDPAVHALAEQARQLGLEPDQVIPHVSRILSQKKEK